MINIVDPIAVVLVVRVAGQFFPVRTAIDLVGRVEDEIGGRESFGFRGGSFSGMQAVLEAWLFSKTRVTVAKVNIGDVSIELLGLA